MTSRRKSYVAFAADGGIEYVLPLATTVLEREPESRFQLFYGSRDTATMQSLEDVLALKNVYLQRFSVHFVMSQEPQEVPLFNGELSAPKVRELAATEFEAAAVDEYVVSGPGDMSTEISAVLRELGGSGRVHVPQGQPKASAIPADAAKGLTAATIIEASRIGADIVDAEQVASTASMASAAAATDAVVAAAVGAASDFAATFVAEITVLMDGRRRKFNMNAEDDSILDAAARVGIELPFSCKAGVCSTCRTKLVRGSVEMAQNYALEDWEVDAGFVLCCQSKPTTPDIEISYDER